MTNLQIVQVFKDPQTVDQTEGAVQAQWYSPKFMNAQNENIFTRQITEKGELLVRTRQDKISSATLGGRSKQPERFRGGLE